MDALSVMEPAANREVNNFLKATLCVLGGIPFYCHESLDWKEKREPTDLQGLKDSILPGERLKVCEGWKSAVSRYSRRGWYRDPEIRRTRRLIAEMACKHLNAALSESPGSPERAELLAGMKPYVEILGEDLKQFKRTGGPNA